MKIRILLLLVLIFALLGLSVALAQRDVALAPLLIDIRPEYDQSAILVIYQATLSPDVSLPAELTFRIPASAGEPYALATEEPDGSLSSVANTRELRGDVALIKFTAHLPKTQLEYYES